MYLMAEKKARKDVERFNVAELARVEDELRETKRAYGIEEKIPWWQKLGDRYYEWKDARVLHEVSRKKYLWLCVLTGWCGGHRFYERRWILGILYLALCWSGFPIAMAMVDFLIALPMKPDENGCIR